MVLEWVGLGDVVDWLVAGTAIGDWEGVEVLIRIAV